MKKLLLVIPALLCMLLSRAQTIPNASLENWNFMPFEQPALPWLTSNIFSVPYQNLISIKRVPGYNSTNALRMEVVAVPGDTSIPFFGNELNGPFDTTGGQQYTPTSAPTAITGFFRYHLPSDTAFLYVLFKKNGVAVAGGLYPIAYNSSNLNFTSFSVPVTASAIPDSVIILAFIGDADGDVAPQPGSWMELDSLSFNTGSGMHLAHEGNFENWDSYSIDAPVDWENGSYVSDVVPDAVMRTTDKHTGMYAASIVTTEDKYFEEVWEGTLSTMVALQPVGIHLQDSLIFYYKYSTPATGTDFGVVSITYLQGDKMPISSISEALDTASSYTRMAMALDQRPASAQFALIEFKSSSGFTPKEVGSTLIVDDVSMIRVYLNVDDVPVTALKVYPNPATDILTIENAVGMGYSISDMTGKVLLSGNVKENHIQVQQLLPGNYLLQLQSVNGSRHTVMFSKQ